MLSQHNTVGEANRGEKDKLLKEGGDMQLVSHAAVDVEVANVR